MPAKPAGRRRRENPAANHQSPAQRLRLRNSFFRQTIDPWQVLQVIDAIPGARYFVKDVQGRLMATSRETARRLGFSRVEDIIGKLPQEFLPKDLADKYHADDQWVVEHGKPRLNIVEINFNEQGVRDWTVADKYPLFNAKGRAVGLVGIIRTFENRRKLLAHLGPVGAAADYIRENLGQSLHLPEIAAQAGFSPRQLQRLFRRVFRMSVQQFVIQTRIHAAIEELIHTDRPIADIAMNVGFYDQSAFSNTFRRMLGISPREYRRRHVEGLGHADGQ